VARRRKGDAIDGVLLLDKPVGITSNAALQSARRLLDAAKAGHTGTLDPLAGGLLPLTFGEATKFSADLLEADKSYEAAIRLGVRTRTGDAEGEVIGTAEVSVCRDQVEAALRGFVGTIEQVPPMHSALKRGGRPLYELARAGVEVGRAARPVTIHRIELLQLDSTTLRVAIDCSKGTYVRALADDLGQRLGCGAHLAALTRTRVGPFRLGRAVSLHALQAMPLTSRRECLLAPDALVLSLPPVELAHRQTQAFMRGGTLDLGPDAAGGPGRKRVYGGGRLLGVADLDRQGVLHPRRLVAAAGEPAGQLEPGIP
jgi:tRNA pseudouridine55 synthase